MSYDDDLTDERWKQLSRNILRRDGAICQDCKSFIKPLQVHHLYYINGKRAWEYPPSALLTLCNDCHENRHKAKRKTFESVAECPVCKNKETRIVFADCIPINKIYNVVQKWQCEYGHAWQIELIFDHGEARIITTILN